VVTVAATPTAPAAAGKLWSTSQFADDAGRQIPVVLLERV
jgi:hypothetical protein